MCSFISIEMEMHYFVLNINFCQNLFVQHIVLACKFDCSLGNMEGVSSSKIRSVVALCNFDPYICCISRRCPSCLLEALQVGEKNVEVMFSQFCLLKLQDTVSMEYVVDFFHSDIWWQMFLQESGRDARCFC
jgi:hypothetical protein